MIACGIAVAVSFVVIVLVVPVLRRITGRGQTPRLAVLAWLSVSLTVYASWALTGLAAVEAALHEPVSAPLHDMMVRVTGAHWPIHVLCFLVGVALMTPFAKFLYHLANVCIGARRGRERRRGALRMLGTHPADAQDVAVVASDLPMIYCMPGKPDVIVVTTAAKNSLRSDQFEAVLEHERTHLAERHHVLVAVATAIGLAGRRIWLFGNTEQFVRDLVEMRADDAAVRKFGPRTVITAISKLSAATPPPPALGAVGRSVMTRILRMSDPPSRGDRVLAGAMSCFLASVCCAHLVVTVAVPVILVMAGGPPLYSFLPGHFP